MPVLSRSAGFGASRRLVGRAGEMVVSPAPGSSSRDDRALPRFDEVGSSTSVSSRCSNATVPTGTSSWRSCPFRPVRAEPRPVGAARGRIGGMEPVVDEGVQVGAGDQMDGAPVTAVAAVGPPAGGRLLAAKAQAPTPAVTGGHADVDFVDEHAWKEIGRGGKQNRKATLPG